MSKGFLALTFLASAILLDPPRVMGLLGSNAQLLGWHINSTIGGYLPRPVRGRG